MPDALVGALTPWRSGPCQVSIDYEGDGARGVFTLCSEGWNVRATRELLEQLEQLAGPGNVSGAVTARRLALARTRASCDPDPSPVTSAHPIATGGAHGRQLSRL